MKTFILSLGVQRSGTTWLRGFLNNLPNTDMGFKKEYHYWDSNKEFVNNQEYISYFNSLIKDDIYRTGDITPRYSLLDINKLKEAKDCIEGAGFNLKIVFTMRDPVQRLWSRAKMMSTQDPEGWMRTYKGRLEQRQNYKSILNNIDNVFNKENVYISLYESFFTEKNIRKFCNFIDCEFRHEDLLRVPSHTTIKRPLSLDTKEYFLQEYKKTYEYCGERFPETKLLWG